MYRWINESWMDWPITHISFSFTNLAAYPTLTLPKNIVFDCATRGDYRLYMQAKMDIMYKRMNEFQSWTECWITYISFSFTNRTAQFNKDIFK